MFKTPTSLQIQGKCYVCLIVGDRSISHLLGFLREGWFWYLAPGEVVYVVFSTLFLCPGS